MTFTFSRSRVIRSREPCNVCEACGRPPGDGEARGHRDYADLVDHMCNDNLAEMPNPLARTQQAVSARRQHAQGAVRRPRLMQQRTGNLKPVTTVPMAFRHRGADPEDEWSFGSSRIGILRQAVSDLCWLLDHGYGIASAKELVGDRYRLSRRQRIAVARCACSSAAKERRKSRCVADRELRSAELWLDGFNVLTAVEAALGGGVILLGRDGCCRDVAGVYSHYHNVVETVPALRLIGRFASQRAVIRCRRWLDSPVDNCGRLKLIIQEVASEAGWPWEVEIVTNPDRVLSSTDHIVATSDHAILDQCQRWFNLSHNVISEHVPRARMMDLGLEQDTSDAP